MRAFFVRQRLGWRWFFLAWLAAALFGVLGGCAAPGGLPVGATGVSRDLITASDEPEVRRRARIRLELASSYFEQGQTTVALDELKQSLSIDPGYAEAYNLRGLIYMRLNDMRVAEQSFRRAISLNPREPDTLHNYGWLLCQQSRYDEAQQAFSQALASPTYSSRAKTLMAQGLCLMRAGRPVEAERALASSYELDAGNPIIGYNLAYLLYRRNEFTRAQFYIRRLNNSELANAESLWLGIRVERRLDNDVAVGQLAEQLRKRYPNSAEYAAYRKEAFHE